MYGDTHNKINRRHNISINCMYKYLFFGFISSHSENISSINVPFPLLPPFDGRKTLPL